MNPEINRPVVDRLKEFIRIGGPDSDYDNLKTLLTEKQKYSEPVASAHLQVAFDETDDENIRKLSEADINPNLDPLPLVPVELKAKSNWLRWKLEQRRERLTKVPYQLNGYEASSTDRATWNTYEAIVKDAVMDETQGVGMATDGTFVGFDLDGCRNPTTGEIAEWAKRIISLLNTYCEITPSGAGLRVYAFGELPDGPRRFSLAVSAGFGDKVGIETYSEKRYFTITGNRLGETSVLRSPNVLPAYELCRAISREFASEKRKSAASFQSYDNNSTVAFEPASRSLTNKFAVLMYGKITSTHPFVIDDEHGGKVLAPSQSEADMSLATLLALKHGENAEAIDSDFRESALYRPKWDRLAEKTIKKAIESAKRINEKTITLTQTQAAPNQSNRVLNFVRGDSVKPKRLKWLWRGRILADKLNVFSGEPDVGKGMTTVDLAARITRHLDFPDCKNELDGPRDVLFLSSEDDTEDTIVPRLKVAGADMTKIHFAEISENSSGTLTEGIVCLDRDLPVLEEMIKKHPEIVLIIPDPVIAFLGDADPNKDKDVRPIYSKMKAFAKRLNVGWLFVNHWNKNQSATSINRTSGAKTMVSAPRATWMFTRSPEDSSRYLMMKGKGNLTSDIKTLAYRIVGQDFDFGDGQGIEPSAVPKLIWDGETDHATEDVLQDANDPKLRRNTKAEEFLTRLLQDDAKLATDVYRAGDKESLSTEKLKRARYALD